MALYAKYFCWVMQRGMRQYFLISEGQGTRRVKVIIVMAWVLTSSPVPAQNQTDLPAKKKAQAAAYNLSQRLQEFYPLEADAEYSITVCGNVPDNQNPGRVFKKGEPGHVFLILRKKESLTGNEKYCSFGFYPIFPVSCIVKKVRSEIHDNSNTEYDVCFERKLNSLEFTALLQNALRLSKKKYDLTKYNCYDYALQVYNDIPGMEPLPVSKVKLPFIFGKGGSPCGLYSDFQLLISEGSPLSAYISFGAFTSPMTKQAAALVAFQ